VSGLRKGSPQDIVQECGVERQKDGRMIPYVRVMHKSQAYVWTQYGCQAIRDLREVAPLFKHERRGKTSWGMAVDTMEMERGEASKILQGAWGKSETSRLYSAVEGVRVNLEVCDDPSKALEFYFSHGNFSHEGRVFSYLDLLTGCDGIPPDLRQRLLEHYQKQRPGMIHPSPIHDAVLQAIQTGDTRGIRILAKCIVAVDRTRKKGGAKLWKVANAVVVAAGKSGRVPTWKKAMEEFRNAGGETDDANFVRDLRTAGFGWLLPVRCQKSRDV